jgi:hypothetical protein
MRAAQLNSMSHTSAPALRATDSEVQIGSKFAKSACGMNRSARAAARCEIAGVASASPTQSACAGCILQECSSIHDDLGSIS